MAPRRALQPGEDPLPRMRRSQLRCARDGVSYLPLPRARVHLGLLRPRAAERRRVIPARQRRRTSPVATAHEAAPWSEARRSYPAKSIGSRSRVNVRPRSAIRYACAVVYRDPLNHSRGSTAGPPCLISKCRWAGNDGSVAPIDPITWPLVTRDPFDTPIRLSDPYTE
jgi:hypothetical protein